MDKGIIITLPRHDDLTEYLSAFSKNVIKEAFDKGIKLKELKDKEATRSEFEKAVVRLNYSMIILNGHGTPSSIKGYKDEILVSMGLNEHLLKEKIVYARSCEAGINLGKSICSNSKNGCFIGYLAPFKFWARNSSAHDPTTDNVAKMFLEPSNLIPISLIKGSNTEEANQKSKRQMLKNMNKLLRNKDSLSITLARDLWNNYFGQVLFGNEKAFL